MDTGSECQQCKHDTWVNVVIFTFFLCYVSRLAAQCDPFLVWHYNTHFSSSDRKSFNLGWSERRKSEYCNTVSALHGTFNLLCWLFTTHSWLQTWITGGKKHEGRTSLLESIAFLQQFKTCSKAAGEYIQALGRTDKVGFKQHLGFCKPIFSQEHVGVTVAAHCNSHLVN